MGAVRGFTRPKTATVQRSEGTIATERKSAGTRRRTAVVATAVITATTVVALNKNAAFAVRHVVVEVEQVEMIWATITFAGLCGP